MVHIIIAAISFLAGFMWFSACFVYSVEQKSNYYLVAFIPIGFLGMLLGIGYGIYQLMLAGI